MVRGVAFDVLLTIVRQIVTSIISLLFTVLVGRGLGATLTGHYAFLVLVARGMVNVTSLGLGVSTAHLLPGGSICRTQAVRLLLVGWGLLSLIGGGGLFVLISCFDVLPIRDNDLFVLGIVGALFSILLLSDYGTGLLQGLQRHRLFNIACLLGPLATLFLATLLYFRGALTLEVCLLAFLMGQAITTFLLFLFSGVAFGSEPSTDKELPLTPSAFFTVGFHLYLVRLLSFFTKRLDFYLLYLLSNASIAGVYFVALQILERLYIVSTSTSFVLFPKFSVEKSDDSSELMLVSFRLLSYVLVFAVAGVVGVSIFFVEPIFGSEFKEVTYYLVIFSPAVMTTCLSSMLIDYLLAIKLYGQVLRILTKQAILAVSVGVVIIPVYGVEGAASMACLASFFGLSMLGRTFLKSSKKQFKVFFQKTQIENFMVHKLKDAISSN